MTYTVLWCAGLLVAIVCVAVGLMCVGAAALQDGEDE